MLTGYGKKLDHVLVLDAPDEELVMRIAGPPHLRELPGELPRRREAAARGRASATAAAARSSSAATTPRRSSATACASSPPRPSPVLDYFEQTKWPVRKIDANGNMDQIFGRIYAAVLLS